MKTAKTRIILVLLAVIVGICLFSSVVSAGSINKDAELKTETFTVDARYWLYDDVKQTKSRVYDNRNRLLSNDIIVYDKVLGYGGELTQVQKNIYDVLVSNYVTDGMCSSNTTPVTYTLPENSYTTDSIPEINLAITRACFAFFYDYPQVFWTSGFTSEMSYMGYNNSNVIFDISISITLTEKYPNAKNDITKYNNGVVSAAEKIVTAVSGNSIYEYYRAIHDWMCNNMSYNDASLTAPDEHPMAHSSAGVFVGDGCVVCQGYGEAFKVLCDYIRTHNNVDLYTTMVIGKADTENHMWNYAYMPDGNWYALDVCWDDQVSGICDTYFMVGSNTQGFDYTFSEEHKEDNRFDLYKTVAFTYPVISTEKYFVPANITITGSITSFGDTNEAVTLRLLNEDGGEITTTTATDGSYELTAAAGTYTLEVSKKNHVTREYEVTVEDVSSTQDVEIWLLGDINGDGKIKAGDYKKVKNHYDEVELLSGYALQCADVTGDGKIKAGDYKKIKNHYDEVETLW